MIDKKNLRYRFEKIIRFFKYRILHANDSPASIAAGIAIGIFVAWTPAIGLHILLAVSIAALLRANKFAAFVCAWISNPFTFVPIYYPNFLLGRKLMHLFCDGSEISNTSAKELWGQINITSGVVNIFCIEFWRNLFQLFWHYALLELWLGSIVMGIALAIAGYYLTYNIVVRHRKANPHRRFASTKL